MCQYVDGKICSFNKTENHFRCSYDSCSSSVVQGVVHPLSKAKEFIINMQEHPHAHMSSVTEEPPPSSLPASTQLLLPLHP